MSISKKGNFVVIFSENMHKISERGQVNAQRGCELSLEEESIATQECLMIVIRIFHSKILHTTFVTDVFLWPSWPSFVAQQWLQTIPFLLGEGPEQVYSDNKVALDRLPYQNASNWYRELMQLLLATSETYLQYTNAKFVVQTWFC